ncbi:unnamed protein product [Prorocentrum cordatum]|uniref:Uncharacterized protein n=1 Tax=Prorocentrum cordatum TaxID=2364126 RepID=A0ABN9TFN1_9DINO|nr:unnamed protein product [Polarella glacialis]
MALAVVRLLLLAAVVSTEAKVFLRSGASVNATAAGPAAFAGDPPLLFSEESCQAMGSTKAKLGGPVPPAEVVPGCTEVCDMIKGMKEYWMTGGMATWSCDEAKKYGCVWGSGADLKNPSDIAC